MAWQYHPLLLFFAFGGLVSLGVAGYCRRYTRKYGWSYLVVSIGLLGVFTAIWVFAATLKTASTDLDLSLLFYKLEFVGILPNSIVILVVALAVVGRDRWFKRRLFALLSLIPTALLSLVVINPANLMIVEPTLISSQGILAFEHEFPPLFVLCLGWVYGTALIAILIIAEGWITDRITSTPALTAIVVLLVPFATALVKSLGIYPPGGDGINVTPAANAFGISILAFAIIRYRIFELIPVGRHHAIEAMDAGYLLLGPDKTVLDANSAAAKLVGGHPNSKLGHQPVDSLIPVYDDLGEDDSIDFDIKDRTVSVRRSEVTRQNRTAGEILILQDVTEARQREQELERANARLDQFASTVSHDLRNPLNVITGRVAILEGAKTQDVEEHTKAIRQAATRMDELIDDLLTLARQGQAVGEFERVELDEVAKTCYRDLARTDGTLEVEDNYTVEADRSRLRQLLGNLFRNSVEHGGSDVSITIGTTEHGFVVADDGPGIPEDERSDIFKPGYSTAEDGTGLGLTIVKEIAEAHGWEIDVTQSESDGTRFEISTVDVVE